MADRLQDTLNGGFKGLFGEVVEDDIYRLNKIGFIPDVIFDLGSNIGIFARFARELFPEAIIVCVEPDADNFENLVKFTPSYKINFLNKAIGIGKVWRHIGARNGAGESYVSDSIGYREAEMKGSNRILETDIATVMPDALINEHWKEGMKSVMKMDIEVGENAVWSHKASMDAIKKMDYFTGEIHFSAFNGASVKEVICETYYGLHQFNETHDLQIHNNNFWATKRK